MVNINAQEYINQKYPIEGVCKRDNDPKNKGKRREEVTILDISQGKVGSNYFSDGKTLVGSLKLEGFTNLRTLIVSSHQLISLDLTGLKNLEIISCRDNYLSELDFSSLNSEKIIYLDLRNNNFLEQNLSAFSNFTNLRLL